MSVVRNRLGRRALYVPATFQWKGQKHVRMMSQAMHQASDKVHILGIGSLGKFLAHSLRKSHPEVPITLLSHRRKLLKDWEEASKGITLVTDGNANFQQNFDVDLVLSSKGETISNLIVATKADRTKEALEPLVSRMTQSTSLLLLQNGMGTIEEVRALFASPYTRPNMIAGIVSHGVYSSGPLTAVHAGTGPTWLGEVGHSNPHQSQSDTKNRYLIDLMLSTPTLNASLFPPKELLQIQLRKLAINAVINPLTVVFDCKNGDVFRNPDCLPYIQDLVVEISEVTRRILETSGATKGIVDEFSEENILDIVTRVGWKTEKNISSMRQDFLMKRKTEIDYINGYIVRQASRFEIPVPCNQKIVDLVKSREQEYLPRI